MTKTTTARRPKTRSAKPAATAPGQFMDPADLPEDYGMRVSGDCLAPEIADGEILRMSKTAPYAAGDFVVIFLRPEAVPPGGFNRLVKKLTMAPAPWVKFPWTDSPKSDVHPIIFFDQLNPPRRYQVKCSAILDIHKVVERNLPAERTAQ